MITRELLNQNRVLTMSNNRKCDYLIVDVGSNDTTSMIGINTKGNTKDVLVIKTFKKCTNKELVDSAYWICKEFDIHIILADCLGYGIGFIDTFKANVPDNQISIREINILNLENRELNQQAYFQIEKDLQYGNLRLLQTPEMANNSYQKPFLGYSDIMQFHNETNDLVNELANIKLEVCGNGLVKLSRIDDTISKAKVNCLFIYYSYPFNCLNNIENEDNKKYDIAKRMSQYYINRGVFYKYMFKSIEDERLQTIFFYNHKGKIKQFENMTKETEFKELFNEYIKNIKITKEDLEIVLTNDSRILFKGGSDGSRGYRYHFAVVDTDIDTEIFHNVIQIKGVLFDIAKRDKLLNDNYNIEFIQM